MPENKPKISINIETFSAIFIIAFVSVFILSNFAIGFSWPIYLLAMLVAGILSVIHPRSGLYAIVFLIMIFERFFTLASIYISRAEYKLYPIDVVMGAIFIGLVFQFLKKSPVERKNFKLVKNDKFLIGFILLNVVYFLFSAYILKTNILLSFSSMKNYAFYSLFYFLAFMLIDNKESLKRLFNFFLSGAILIIGFIIYGVLNGGGLWTQFTPLSTPGIRILAFTHGLYLSLAFVPLAIYLIMRKNPAKEKYLRLLLLIWFLGIVGTMMRHLWIALAVSAAGIYFLWPKKNRREARKLLSRSLILFLVIGIFCFYFLSMAPYSKMSGRAEMAVSAVAERGSSIASASSDESFAWRELVWAAAWKDFKHDPLFGIGTGKTIYVQKENYQDFVEVRNIHNSYLAIMIQLGILTFGFLAVFVLRNVSRLARLIRRQKDNFNAVAIFGALAVYLVAIMFQPYLETNLLAVFFWMALGLSRNIVLEKYENPRNK